MYKENWKKFIQKYKTDYFRVGSVSCPAFDGKLVHFTSHGFRHLVIKYGMPRPKSDQRRRLRLVNKCAKIILETSATYTEYRHLLATNKCALPTYFWSFEKIVHKKLITLVVRQIGSAEKHFFSIMDRKVPKAHKPRKGFV